MNLSGNNRQTIDRGDIVLYKRIPFTVTYAHFKMGRWKYDLLSTDGKISFRSIPAAQVYLFRDRFYINNAPSNDNSGGNDPAPEPYVIKIRDMVNMRRKNYIVGMPKEAGRVELWDTNYNSAVMPSIDPGQLALVEKRDFHADSYSAVRQYTDTKRAMFDVYALTYYNYYFYNLFANMDIDSSLTGYNRSMNMLWQFHKTPLTGDSFADILVILFDGLRAVSAGNSAKVYNSDGVLLFEQFDKSGSPNSLRVYSQNSYNGAPADVTSCSGFINQFVPGIGKRNFYLPNNIVSLGNLTLGDETGSPAYSLLKICEIYGIHLNYKYNPPEL